MPRTEPRPPTQMTEASLAAAAEFYLSRYASSSGNLKQVLVRKVRRSARHYGDDPAPLLEAVDAVVARHLASGAVDDPLYAESQIRKLRRRGASARAITQRLAAKGVPRDIIGDAEIGGDGDDALAAVQLARRRRLGPFRLENRADHRQKDMAALGRAGFSRGLATRIVDAADADALEAILAPD